MLHSTDTHAVKRAKTNFIIQQSETAAAAQSKHENLMMWIRSEMLQVNSFAAARPQQCHSCNQQTLYNLINSGCYKSISVVSKPTQLADRSQQALPKPGNENTV